jgi:ABC-type antimicrobial peptide transport system ATPase subunit
LKGRLLIADGAAPALDASIKRQIVDLRFGLQATTGLGHCVRDS